METIGTPAVWIGFTAAVLAMLALDLGVFHRKSHVVSFREALGWSIVWVALALAFNAYIAVEYGSVRGMEFLTGYVIEKALSIDNIFVFLMIFTYFKVDPKYQHRVLFWGVLGALAMRAIFIALGAALIQSYHWVLYIFGAFLVVTGVKMLFHSGEIHPERNPLFLWFARVVPSVPEYHEDKFFIRRGGRILATPLLLVLVAVELSDLIFAVDSIPAIFAITEDPFIVYTSNVFAILGLRSLYFLLAGVMGMFRHLKTGLALVLAFVGVKMLIAELWKIPIGVSLTVVATLILGAIAVSIVEAKIARHRGSGPTPG